MKGKILFARWTPYDEDNAGYNVQGIGIAKAFCRLGYSCDYLNFNKKKNNTTVVYKYGDCIATVVNLKRFRVMRSGLNFTVLNRLFLNQYDYVICREYNQIMTYLVSKISGNVSMYSGPYWNMFMIPCFSWIYDFFFINKIDHNLQCKFVKSELAKSFLEHKGFHDLINVGVGLDTTAFSKTPPQVEVNKLKRYMENNTCLLYIGTIDKNKNVEFLLNVFSKLKLSKPSLKLIIIGKSKQTVFNKMIGKKDISYKNEIFAKFSPIILNDVIYFERIDNSQLQYIYPVAKAFILPSINEIFGMVMLEAMYFGTPVITSVNGGSSTLIKDDRYGIVLDKFDVAQWVLAISKVLDNPEYAEQIKKNGKELIRSSYTWDAVAANMLAHIKYRGK